MPIRALVYVSEACAEVGGREASAPNPKLDAIVQDAKRFNLSAGVTGVLKFDGMRFLQYIEGPEDGLSVVYSRIVGSSSHSGLIELQRGALGKAASPLGDASTSVES